MLQMAAGEERRERLILRAPLKFILKASGGGVRYSDKEWADGIVFLTDKNLWFKVRDRYFKIPLARIESVSREPVVRVVEGKVLVVDYDDGSAVAATALLLGAAHVINTLKHQIAFHTGKEPRIELRASDIDNKLVTLLSLGVRDWERLKFLLGVDDEKLKESFEKLKNWGLLEPTGRLSVEGIRYADKLAK
jgi:helix-turn-helix protein